MVVDAWHVQGVDTPGVWCDLVVFASSRTEFIKKASTLGYKLPRRWQKLRAEPFKEHTCRRDDMLHVIPIAWSDIAMVGEPEVLVHVLEENAKIKKQPSYHALALAVETQPDVWTCTISM